VGDDPKLAREDYQPQQEGAQAWARQRPQDEARDRDRAPDNDEENLPKIKQALARASPAADSLAADSLAAASPVATVMVSKAIARLGCLEQSPIFFNSSDQCYSIFPLTWPV
jgi:hypothetical protein